MNQPWYFKEADIYQGIPESVLCQLAPTAFEKKYSKGVQIYSPHEENDKVYVVNQGEVTLHHSRGGKRFIFDTLPAGSVFGNFNPDQKNPSHFAETTKGTVLCVTPMHEFLEIIKQNPEMMLRFMQKMAHRIQDYEVKIKSHLDTASERILTELKRLDRKRKESFLGKLMHLPLQITHEKLAEYTNLNRVTVTRSLQTLKKEGFIAIDEKGVIEILK